MNLKKNLTELPANKSFKIVLGDKSVYDSWHITQNISKKLKNIESKIHFIFI